MTERHYGNDVPTGPIPVIPPQDHTDVPASGRPPSIPTQRDTSTSGGSGEPAGWPERAPRRRRWMWLLLALLAVLCVAAALLLSLVDTAHAGEPVSAPSSTQGCAVQ
jgi:hypothetical protein